MTKLKFRTGIMEMALIKSDKEAQAKDAHVGGLQLVQSPQMNKKGKNLNGATCLAVADWAAFILGLSDF